MFKFLTVLPNIGQIIIINLLINLTECVDSHGLTSEQIVGQRFVDPVLNSVFLNAVLSTGQEIHVGVGQTLGPQFGHSCAKIYYSEKFTRIMIEI